MESISRVGITVGNSNSSLWRAAHVQAKPRRDVSRVRVGASPPPRKKPKLDHQGEIVDQTAKDTSPRSAGHNHPQHHPQGSPIYIDLDGNLKLVVGPGAVEMHVDANALRRASKVFKRMLFGPFMESNQGPSWTVDLPEDDSEALRVLFHAAHANCGSIPSDLKLTELYKITMMADKYAMMGSLQPWMSNWTSTKKHPEMWKSDDKEETSYEDLKKLCILYYFGTIQQFQEVLVNLMLKTRASRNGKLLFEITAGVDGKSSGSETSEWEKFQPLPQTVIDFARTNRYKLISRLLRGLKNVFTSCTSEGHDSKFKPRCRSTALGVMTQRLVQEGLWPIPNAEDVCLSVFELSKIADKIQVQMSQVMDRCQCRSGKRRLLCRRFERFQVFGHEWRSELISDTWMKFLERPPVWKSDRRI